MEKPQPRAIPRPGQPREMPVYLGLVGLYFYAFGLQFVLFPTLAAFVLEAPPSEVGLAQMALSMPMALFLLAGGVVAERTRAGPTLALLQLCFAAPAFAMAAIIAFGHLSFPVLIAYAIAMGTAAAFMLPVRDAALNGVVQRDLARGGRITIANAAASTTAVQIGAQILGILTAQLAGGGPAPYFALLGVTVCAASALALRLQAPPPQSRARSLGALLADIRDGLIYAFNSKVMGPMLWSAAYVGVFVIGSFQVLFPLVVRDGYAGDATHQAQRLAMLFACFWGASFVSAATLSRLPPIARPGRALIVSHLVGSAALLTFAIDKPFWMFAAIVALWGLASGVAISMSRTITQAAANPAFLGRVLAIYSLGFMGGAPIGSAIMGLAAQELGPRTAAVIPGLGLAVASGALAIWSPIWRLGQNLRHEA